MCTFSQSIKTVSYAIDKCHYSFSPPTGSESDVSPVALARSLQQIIEGNIVILVRVPGDVNLLQGCQVDCKYKYIGLVYRWNNMKECMILTQWYFATPVKWRIWRTIRANKASQSQPKTQRVMGRFFQTIWIACDWQFALLALMDLHKIRLAMNP